MAAKVITVNGYTIPGPSGNLSVEGETIDDTILGQSWSSNFVGLIGWNIGTTAYYKGKAGYESIIKKSGAAMSAQSFELSQTADVIDKSDLPTVQGNNGYRVKEMGLRTVELSVSGFVTGLGMMSDLENRSTYTIQITAGGSGMLVAEGDFIYLSDELSGDVGALESEELSFGLHVPTDGSVPFTWTGSGDSSSGFAADSSSSGSGDTPEAVVQLIDSFLQKNNVSVEYKPQGSDGSTYSGEAFVTDLSLSSGTDGNVEFSVELEGAGALTTA